eukprot:1617625-Amphidinium_carterae.1
MIACERLQGQGVIVTDCKGAAVVANKLKLGVRKSGEDTPGLNIASLLLSERSKSSGCEATRLHNKQKQRVYRLPT